MSQTKAQLLDGKSATIQFTGGSVSAPSVSFTGDTNTGIYSPGADQVAISTGGSGRLFVDASGNVGIGLSPTSSKLYVNGAFETSAFMVSQASNVTTLDSYNYNLNIASVLNGGIGGNILFSTGSGTVTERLRIDSSGRLLVGTSSSSAVAKVVVQGITTDPNALGVIQLQVGTTTPADATRLGRIDFTDSAGGAGVWIQAERDGGTWTSGSSHPTRLLLSTTANGAASPAERMRIDSSGRVGIGTSPYSVSGGSALTIGSGSANAEVNFLSSATGLGGLYFGDGTSGNTTYRGYIEYDHASDCLKLATSSTERARIDSSGRLLVGTSSARSNFFNGSASAAFQLEGTGTNRRAAIIGDDFEGSLILASQKSGAVGGNTILANGDPVGAVSFQGNDGSEFVEAAKIEVAIDGTPGANDMPGRLVFSTTADGASSPTERMRIDSSGQVLVNTNVAFSKVTVATTASNDGLTLYTAATPGTNPATLSFGANNNASDPKIIARIRGVLVNGGVGGEAGALTFSTGTSGAAPVERMRIKNDGYTRFTNDGTITNSTLSFHGFDQDQNDSCLYLNAGNVSFAASCLSVYVQRASNSAYSLASFYSTHDPGISADLEFNLRGDGQAFADGAWNGGGADYAEYFEWSDLNPSAEDRRGISVVLDGDKIREAVAGEDPIGVISGNPSVVGDAAWNKWSGKYLRDEFGTYIQEDYEVTDDDGNTVIQQRRKLNPAYDPDADYISREERPEWDCVGLMGKLRIRKGQVTGSRWIKMRDISDTVEEWLVR